MSTRVSFGCSVRGASHEQHDIEKQDAAQSATLTDLGAHIVAVADGHGDPTCARSAEGARIAVEVALETLEWLARSVADVPARREALREGRLDLSRITDSIVAQWSSRVSEHYALHPELGFEATKAGQEPSYGEDHEAEAAQEPEGSGEQAHPSGAQAARPSDPRKSETEKHRREHLYGTTLVCGLVMGDDCVLIQLGDGCCCVILSDGTVLENEDIMPEDPLCIGNVTTSLSDSAAAREIRAVVVDSGTFGNPVGVFVGTDGVDKSLPPRGTSDFCCGVALERARRSHQTGWDAFLEERLSHLSANGAGDDTSLSGFVDISGIRRVSGSLKAAREQYAKVNELGDVRKKILSMKRRHDYLLRPDVDVDATERARYLSEYDELELLRQDLEAEVGPLADELFGPMPMDPSANQSSGGAAQTMRQPVVRPVQVPESKPSRPADPTSAPAMMDGQGREGSFEAYASQRAEHAGAQAKSPDTTVQSRPRWIAPAIAAAVLLVGIAIGAFALSAHDSATRQQTSASTDSSERHGDVEESRSRDKSEVESFMVDAIRAKVEQAIDEYAPNVESDELRAAIQSFGSKCADGLHVSVMKVVPDIRGRSDDADEDSAATSDAPAAGGEYQTSDAGEAGSEGAEASGSADGRLASADDSRGDQEDVRTTIVMSYNGPDAGEILDEVQERLRSGSDVDEVADFLNDASASDAAESEEARLEITLEKVDSHLTMPVLSDLTVSRRVRALIGLPEATSGTSPDAAEDEADDSASDDAGSMQEGDAEDGNAAASQVQDATGQSDGLSDDGYSSTSSTESSSTDNADSSPTEGYDNSADNESQDGGVPGYMEGTGGE